VVHEQEQIVRAGRERLVHARNGRTVLADISGAGGFGSIHADAVFIGAMPLAPAVTLGGFHVDAVVISGDVG
jgi:hypothetical protein